MTNARKNSLRKKPLKLGRIKPRLDTGRALLLASPCGPCGIGSMFRGQVPVGSMEITDGPVSF
jgi:hypothetical protein